MAKIDLSEKKLVTPIERSLFSAGDSSLMSRLAALQTLNAKLLCMTDAGIAYDEMVRSAQRVVGCDSCALYLHDPERNGLRLEAASGHSPAAEVGDILFDEVETIHTQAFLEEYLVYVSDLTTSPAVMRRDPDLLSEVVLPISCNKGPAGVLDFGSKRVNGFAEEEIRLCSMLVDQIAFSLDNFRLFADVMASRDAVIRGMALLAESRDNTISQHLDRICGYAGILSERLREDSLYAAEVDEAFIATIARSAALHDVGKVGIPDTILMKPGKLTAEERDIMQTHTAIGGAILEELMRTHGSFPMLKMGADVAYGHHEWWDGEGYPQQLQGRDIPLAARIVAICDVFDALTSKRIYKEAWDVADAFTVVHEQAGRQFDPYLAQVFLSLRTQILQIRERISP